MHGCMSYGTMQLTLEEGLMTATRIDAERVFFAEPVRVPRDGKGISSGVENTFSRNPTSDSTMRRGGRERAYNVYIDGQYVVIEDRDSGEEEWVPYERATQISVSPAAKRKPAKVA